MRNILIIPIVLLFCIGAHAQIILDVEGDLIRLTSPTDANKFIQLRTDGNDVDIDAGDFLWLNSLGVIITTNVEISGAANGLTFPDQSKQTTAYTGKDLFYIRSFKTGLIAPNSSNNVSCTCDEGDEVTGGGWDAYRNGSQIHDLVSNTFYNRPNSTFVNNVLTGGWAVGFRNNSGEIYRITVYCMCANVN